MLTEQGKNDEHAMCRKTVGKIAGRPISRACPIRIRIRICTRDTGGHRSFGNNELPYHTIPHAPVFSSLRRHWEPTMSHVLTWQMIG